MNKSVKKGVGFNDLACCPIRSDTELRTAGTDSWVNRSDQFFEQVRNRFTEKMKRSYLKVTIH